MRPSKLLPAPPPTTTTMMQDILMSNTTDFYNRRSFSTLPTKSSILSSNLSHWEEETARLLRIPVGNETDLDRAQLEHAFQFWITQRTSQSVLMSFSVIDRIVEQLRHDPGLIKKAQYGVAKHRYAMLIVQALENWQHTPTEADDIITGRELLERIDSYSPIILPDIRIYGRIIHGTKRHAETAEAAVQLAELLLQRLHQDNSNLKPDIKFFNIVIHAWADSNLPEAPKRVVALLKQMEDIHSIGEPDTYTLSGVLTALAKSDEPDAAERADAILKKMEDQYDSGNKSMKPNAHSYTTVVSAFARHGQVDMAEATVSRLKERYEQYNHDPVLLPNNFTYCALIDALAKRGKPESARRAEEILQEMCDLSQSTGNPSLRPNVVTFGAALHALAKSGEPDAPLRAEALLDRMQDMGVNPNVAIFSSVIDCWAKSKHEDSAERAEELLGRMEDSDVKPNLITFNTVMDCYAESGRVDALGRVEAVFERLQDLYRKGDESLKPDIVSYSTLAKAISRSGLYDAPERIKAVVEEVTKAGLGSCEHLYVMILFAWSQSWREDAAEKAASVFHQMEHLADGGQENLRPRLRAYVSLLNVFARHGELERAERLILKMEEKSKSSDFPLAPNTLTYNTLLNGFARHSSVKVAKRAEGILARMMAGPENIQPDSISFTTVISALTRCRDPEAGSKAEMYLEHLIRRHEAGHKNCRPTNIIYTAAINAWATCRNSEGVQKAVELLETMKHSRDPELAPNNRTYVAMLRVIADCYRPDKLEFVRRIIVDREHRGLSPTIDEFGEAIRACSLTRGREAYLFAAELWDQMLDLSLCPNYMACVSILRACRNAGDRDDVDMAVERFYTECCHFGFGQNDGVLRMFERVAPDLHAMLK
jgi:pentatricopeptide repeat protein